MKLINKMQEQGNILFKYRGQLPFILFIISIPIIYSMNYDGIVDKCILNYIQNFSILTALTGLLFRYYIIITTPNGTSGRNRSKQIANTLNTKGAYSIIRHPLYLANYLIWIGISLYSSSILLCLFTTTLFIIQYERIIIVEEKFLSKEFKLKFKDFCDNTSIFLPSFKNYKKPKYYFSLKKLIRREYVSTSITIIAFLYIDILHLYFHESNNQFSLIQIISQYKEILLSIIILTMTIKIIKSFTYLLTDNS